jgi:hypothetical protein
MCSAVLANNCDFSTQPAENIKIFAKIAQQEEAVKHRKVPLKPCQHGETITIVALDIFAFSACETRPKSLKSVDDCLSPC